jgi:hypothetical protein
MADPHRPMNGTAGVFLHNQRKAEDERKFTTAENG